INPSPSPLVPALLLPPPTTSTPTTSTSASTPAPHHSTCSHNATEAGQAHANEIAASKARLQTLHEMRMACAEHAMPPTVETEVPNPVSPADKAHPDITEIEPNINLPEVFANVIIEEQANISIRSNCQCNPSSPDYDMKVPLATYKEAMLCPDWSEWLSAMQAELGIMKEMSVYCVVPLPEGHKVIRNR
ncbi:hypothetical protein BDR03DRAFT_1018669, partial [Suillus americanus]